MNEITENPNTTECIEEVAIPNSTSIAQKTKTAISEEEVSKFMQHAKPQAIGNLFDDAFITGYTSAYQNIPYAARIEKLAEEASELAAAASKLARIIRDEFPAKMSEDDAFKDMMGEIVDVVAAIESINLTPTLPRIYVTDKVNELYMLEHAFKQMNKLVKRFKCFKGEIND